MDLLYEDVIEEYFSVASTPRDSKVLGSLEIWIYNSDRKDYPPHCHIKTSDNTIEFEVSILNWIPFRTKKPHGKTINSWNDIDSSIKEKFFNWLGLNSTQRGMEELTNKHTLWIQWNANNPTNTLDKWLEKNVLNMDNDLIEFLNPTIDLKKLYKSIISELTELYFTQPNKRYTLHKLQPQELLNALGIAIDLNNNQEAIDTVVNAEKQVYIWSEK